MIAILNIFTQQKTTLIEIRFVQTSTNTCIHFSIRNGDFSSSWLSSDEDYTTKENDFSYAKYISDLDNHIKKKSVWINYEKKIPVLNKKGVKNEK
jgi:hypothetical protein